jgi:hypothetical protein
MAQRALALGGGQERAAQDERSDRATPASSRAASTASAASRSGASPWRPNAVMPTPAT